MNNNDNTSNVTNSVASGTDTAGVNNNVGVSNEPTVISVEDLSAGVNTVPSANNQPTIVDSATVNNTVTPQPVSPNPNINPNLTVASINQNKDGDNTEDGAVTDEKLKQVEIDYKPPSKFKIFLLVNFFIGLTAFVIFLPDIDMYIRMLGKKEEVIEKIENGRLVCSNELSTTNLTTEYDTTLTFHKNSLEKIRYVISTRGDIEEDEVTLDELNKNCQSIVKETKDLEGISVTCDYSDGLLKQTQGFDLSIADFGALGPIFAEAGGTIPEYKYGDDMDQVEKGMKAAGYSCSREKE